MTEHIGIIAFMTIGIIMFLWLMINIVRTSIVSGMVFMAVAGSNMPGTVRSRSLDELLGGGMLVDKDGQPVDLSHYKVFQTSGRSMLLSGIDDGDLLLTEPVSDLRQLRKLPCVLVLRREKDMKKKAEELDDHALYKVRRTWMRHCLTGRYEDLEQEVHELFQQDEFENVMDKAEEAYKGQKWMMERLRESYDRYLDTHRKCTNRSDRNNQVIISTTLYTDCNEVRFSIHPARIVEGRVSLVYSMEQGRG